MTTVAYTVPTSYGDSKSVVGIENRAGRLCIPSTFVNHAHAGYNPDEVEEVPLPFDDDMSAKLMTVFGNTILRALKYSLYEPDGKYEPGFNCFSFALMLSRPSNKEFISASEAQFIVTDEVIEQGVKIEPSNIRAGQLLAIGKATEPRSEAYHALIGIDEAAGLQVMGPEGSVVIAPHTSVLHFYESLFRLRNADPSIDYGFFASPET